MKTLLIEWQLAAFRFIKLIAEATYWSEQNMFRTEARRLVKMAIAEYEAQS